MVRVRAEGTDPATTQVDDVITDDRFTLRKSDAVDPVARFVQEHGIRRAFRSSTTRACRPIVTAGDLLVQLGRQLSAVGVALAEPADSEDSH